MRLFVIFLMLLLLCSPAMAEQIYVRSNADLPEVEAPTPFEITPALKQFLNDNAPIHPVYGVKYLTRSIAKALLQTSGTQAQAVLDALVADGIIETYQDRYSDQYPSEPTP